MKPWYTLFFLCGVSCAPIAPPPSDQLLVLNHAFPGEVLIWRSDTLNAGNIAIGVVCAVEHNNITIAFPGTSTCKTAEHDTPSAWKARFPSAEIEVTYRHAPSPYWSYINAVEYRE